MADEDYPITTSGDAEAVAAIRKLIPVKTNSITNPQFSSNQISQDAADTRIIVHHKYPELVQAFLDNKREHGSAAEKALYGTPASWTWQQQIARLVQKRALVFKGRHDYTVLRDGTGIGSAIMEWDKVGTDAEADSKWLRLKDYLSYDEMMLGSLLGVSGPSYFINDGDRSNAARPGEAGEFERRGVVVGLAVARLERVDRMDSVFVWPAIPEPRQHRDLVSAFTKFFGKKLRPKRQFNHSMFKARLRITVELLLLEANKRAKAASMKAYVHIVGFGLGNWHINNEQSEVYLEAFLDALDDFGDKLQNIGTLDFAGIDVAKATEHQTVATAGQHGIDVTFSKRNQAARLPPAKKSELLIVSYAWNPNAYPGNGYWKGSLIASEDTATAAMSTIGELHNAILNPQFLGKIEILSPQG